MFDEPTSYHCGRCNLDMPPVEGKYKTWQCPICKSLHRRVSMRQLNMTSIARLDQMIAVEDRPEVKKILETHLEKVYENMRRDEELEKKGVISSDIHEWIFGGYDEEPGY